jgi:hypothetical protein
MVQILPTNTFTTAKWIVSPTASNGTHTTIAGALTSASSGDTIFIRTGTYTENPTLKPGVNLTAFSSDDSLNDTGNVIINGTCTLTTAGSVTISGIQLQTNSADLLIVSGSVASVVNLNNCYLNCLNNTGITFSSSSSSSAINISNCDGNLVTNGITLFNHSSAGLLGFDNSTMMNSGGSTTSSTVSSGILSMQYTEFSFPLTSSGTGAIGSSWCTHSTNAQNVTALTIGGSGNGSVSFGFFSTGTASSISVSSNLTIALSSFTCSNINTISGSGIISFYGLTNNTGTLTINVTTQSNAGTLQGSRNTAPTAGYLGEQIRSAVAFGSAVSLSNGVAKTITSISLTAGIWDVSILGTFVNGTTTLSTAEAVGISVNTNTMGPNPGDDSTFSNYSTPAAGFSPSLIVPAYRVTLTATTTYYFVSVASFTVSTSSVYGRISATRVG